MCQVFFFYPIVLNVSDLCIYLNILGEALKPAMNQLCANIMGHLVTKGLYSVLQNILIKGLVRVKPCLKRAALLAVTNLSVW